MKNLKIVWKNTDWSVSNNEIAAQSEQHRNRNMKKVYPPDMTNSRDTRSFPPLSAPPNPDHEEQDSLIAKARHEAAALAWATGFPFLVLPCLTEELEREAQVYSQNQKRIHEQSARIFSQTFPVVSQQLAA